MLWSYVYVLVSNLEELGSVVLFRLCSAYIPFHNPLRKLGVAAVALAYLFESILLRLLQRTQIRTSFFA